MTRPVSPADIRVLIETQLLDSDLTVFAADAHTMVGVVIPPTANMGEAQLTLIEKYLAAHFTALRDPRVTSLHVGPATTSYEGQSGLYLAHTRYGQQVIAFDTSGAFAALDQAADTGSVADLHVFTVSSCR